MQPKPLSGMGQQVIAELCSGLALIAAQGEPRFKDGKYKVIYGIPVNDQRDMQLVVTLELERQGPAPTIWTPDRVLP